MKCLPEYNNEYLSGKKILKGYTILEIIIAVFIIVILFSVTQASYRQFVLRKSVESVKKNIISDIKLAQVYASSGKKSATCTGLNGYRFISYADINNPDLNYYRIYADCVTDELVKEVYLSKIAKNVVFLVNTNVLFKILGQGTNIPVGQTRIFTIRQSTTNYSATITVSSAGEVR